MNSNKYRTHILYTLFLTIIAIYLVVSGVQAQTPADGTAEDVIEKNAQMLKDKIATKVAELTKKNNTVIVGLLKTILDQNLEIIEADGSSKKVTTDDLLTVYKLSDRSTTKTLKREDLAKGDYVAVFGTALEGEVAANTVYKQVRYDLLEGQVIAVNKTDFSLDVVTTEKEEYTLDIEKTTSQFLTDPKTLLTEKTGFTKLKAGDRIHFVVIHADKKPKRTTAIRILIIPQEYFTTQTPTPAVR